MSDGDHDALVAKSVPGMMKADDGSLKVMVQPYNAKLCLAWRTRLKLFIVFVSQSLKQKQEKLIELSCRLIMTMVDLTTPACLYSRNEIPPRFARQLRAVPLQDSS